MTRRPSVYGKFKTDTCSRCGFHSEVRGVFDIHHIDHDHENDSPQNLLTLCANCHRLRHHEERPARIMREKVLKGPPKEWFSCRVPQELAEDLRAEAEVRGSSLSAVIVRRLLDSSRERA